MFGFDFNNPFTKKKREAEQLARIQALQEEQRDSREQMRSGNWESKKNIENALKQASNNNTMSSHYQPGQSTNRSKYQFEADEEDDRLEDQIDKNLDSLAAGLGTLQAMVCISLSLSLSSLYIGEIYYKCYEVRRQNQVIDRISDKTSALDNRHSKIISGVITVLEAANRPLSLQELVDEMTKRQLVVFHGATPRNTVSGEISKLLNAVGPSNAPILKINQGKLTKFYLRTQQQHEDSLQISAGKAKKRYYARNNQNNQDNQHTSKALVSLSENQNQKERVYDLKKIRQMEDL
ncbi:6011_t:CDS:2, partial [Entrophospora sp. SA101]